MIIDKVNLSQKFLSAKPLQSPRAARFLGCDGDLRGLEDAVHNWPGNQTRPQTHKMVAKPGRGRTPGVYGRMISPIWRK